MSTRMVRIGGSLVIVLGAVLYYLSSIANGPDVELHFERNVTSAQAPNQIAPALEDIRTWPQWFHALAGARFTERDSIDLKAEPFPVFPGPGGEPALADAAGLTSLASAIGKATGGQSGGSPSANTGGTLPTTIPPPNHGAIATAPHPTPAHASEIPIDSRVAAGRNVLLFVDPQKGPWAKFEVLAKITQVVPGKLLVLEVEDDSAHKLTKQFDHLEWRVELRPGSAARPTLIHGEMDAHTAHWRSRLFSQLANSVLMNQVYYMNLFKLASFGAPGEDEPQPDYLRRN